MLAQTSVGVQPTGRGSADVLVAMFSLPMRPASEPGSTNTALRDPDGASREPPERAMVKVGINGFGRIGRLTFRYAFDMPEVEVVHVNELLGGAETAAYLAKYDSVHGTWPHKVDHADDHFTVDGQKISFSDKEDFTQVGLQHTHRRG